MSRSYLDHAATAPLHPAARDAMFEAFDLVGNASSLHTSGRRARSRLEDAREEIAELVGADPAEVVFTSGGTEADNIAIQGGWAGRRAIRPGLILSAIEHPAVLESAMAMMLRGAEVQQGPVDTEGVVSLDWLADNLTERTGICSLMWVNNETGVCQPVPEMAERARAVGALSHSDAVQALGHVPVDFAASGLDLMSLSAHKLGGPVGIGALLARREVGVTAVQYGGGQERDLRSGTTMVALAAGFAAATRQAVDQLEHEGERLNALREQIAEVAAQIEGVSVLGAGAPAVSPAIINLHIAGARADDVLLLLDAAGVDCSTGSACTAGVSQPSHVVAAMGRTDTEAAQSVRFSLGWSTTDGDVDALIAALPDACARARAAGA